MSELLYSLLEGGDLRGLLVLLEIAALGLLLRLQDPHPQVLDLRLGEGVHTHFFKIFKSIENSLNLNLNYYKDKTYVLF